MWEGGDKREKKREWGRITILYIKSLYPASDWGAAKTGTGDSTNNEGYVLC